MLQLRFKKISTLDTCIQVHHNGVILFDRKSWIFWINIFQKNKISLLGRGSIHAHTVEITTSNRKLNTFRSFWRSLRSSISHILAFAHFPLSPKSIRFTRKLANSAPCRYGWSLIWSISSLKATPRTYFFHQDSNRCLEKHSTQCSLFRFDGRILPFLFSFATVFPHPAFFATLSAALSKLLLSRANVSSASSPFLRWSGMGLHSSIQCSSRSFIVNFSSTPLWDPKMKIRKWKNSKIHKWKKSKIHKWMVWKSQEKVDAPPFWNFECKFI